MVKTTGAIALFSSLLLSVIFVIGIFNITSAGVPVIQTAGDSLNDTNLCNTAGCFYNASVTPSCANSSLNQSLIACPTGQHSAQFNTFFGGSGIIILAIMAMIVIGIIGFVLLLSKK